ncbi:hypothetical protein EXIGLDRAFT_830963 [Exidia glandulosa HHB12029]|uniref:DUF803-domain-containing protein n=1 Tax=Exidia glandulosa HHB12029 TaxID=1314781 RepID=A0A165N727_EXIGL|nr:hypothetical protein EXIGLDRAFT_830963 [Exidia glandulosa HHB12029]
MRAPSETVHSGLKPVVAFIVGLLIVLAASVLNALGLNLSKLDHARNAAIPKSARRREFLRPLLVIGMSLYILSQLIGSTLALEYMRAEYVAPLGSSSLVFNFLFANLLVGTQITRTDIYGTIVVLFGVVGIVAFGSINSGLESQMNADRLHTLWTRSGWLLYFIAMSIALLVLFISAQQLETILAARGDLEALPFAAEVGRRRTDTPANAFGRARVAVGAAVTKWGAFLEHWTSAQTDRNLAWTLGIAWACCGGGLAGLCLVFAKASVKLISGKLSHENAGNQFASVAAIFTFILLAVAAVSQIVALNKGLRAYDSTLVVPMFYGVYTASGFLNSLIFNNEVDAYKGWTLALVFLSIVVLIGGVILLTNEKPDPTSAKAKAKAALKMKGVRSPGKGGKDNEPLNADALEDTRGEPMWDVGGESEADDDDEHTAKDATPRASGSGTPRHLADDVRSPFIGADEEDEDDAEHHKGKKAAAAADPFRDTGTADDDDFGDWEDGSKVPTDSTQTHVVRR